MGVCTYCLWRISDDLPDVLFRLTEIQKDIADLNIPTGTPLVYELNDEGFPLQAMPVLDRSLNREAARAAAEAVARQTN